MEELDVNPRARGLAVIITNDYEHNDKNLPKLSGTHKDGDRLDKAFRQLYFDVHWRHNVTYGELGRLLYQLRNLKFETVRHYKCICIVFSGHGERNGTLLTQDCRSINTCKDFIQPLLPGESPLIGDIPKIFIIDACRGERPTETVEVPKRATEKGNSRGESSVDPSPRNIKGGYVIEVRDLPAEGNFLVAHATLPGCIANDYPTHGSLWLRILAEKLPECDVSVEDLLTSVNSELQKTCQKGGKNNDYNYKFQQPEKTSRLNDVLYLLRDPLQPNSAETHEEPMDVCAIPEKHQPSVQSQQLSNQKAVEGITNQAAVARVTSPGAPIASGTSVKQDTQTLAPLPTTREQGSRKFRDRLKQHTNPKYDYISEQLPSGAKRHRCNISFRRDGKVKYADSGGYLTTKQGAAENAAKRALKQENWLSDSEDN